jgi:glyoxylase I family protein
MLSQIQGEYAFVAKVNVSDLDKSVKWYVDKLGLQEDTRFRTDTWRQFNLPGIPRVAIGLNKPVKEEEGTGGGVSTFVVDKINDTYDSLKEKGIDITSPADVGKGVLMCFFKDPDGNSLALRQNPSNHPKAAEIGR